MFCTRRVLLVAALALGAHASQVQAQAWPDKDEKARYIAEAFAGFERILGDLDEESYVYVQDVRASAYGYGGRTQEFRYHH